MKHIKTLALVCCMILLSSCSTKLHPVKVTKHDSLSNYQYIYITPVQDVTSSSFSVYQNNANNSMNTVYGNVQNNSTNPGDIISGIMAKYGYTRLPELVPELIDKTLIINYGESGRRQISLLGYTVEVTIQFISAKTYRLVCTCTGEGMGYSHIGDIRIAITRCLEKTFKTKKGKTW